MTETLQDKIDSRIATQLRFKSDITSPALDAIGELRLVDKALQEFREQIEAKIKYKDGKGWNKEYRKGFDQALKDVLALLGTKDNL